MIPTELAIVSNMFVEMVKGQSPFWPEFLCRESICNAGLTTNGCWISIKVNDEFVFAGPDFSTDSLVNVGLRINAFPTP